MTTDIGLSEIDAMLEQNVSVGQVRPSKFPVENAKVDIPHREVLAAQAKFLQQSITTASLQ